MIVNVPDIDLTIILPSNTRNGEEDEEARVTSYVPEEDHFHFPWTGGEGGEGKVTLYFRFYSYKVYLIALGQLKARKLSISRARSWCRRWTRAERDAWWRISE